MKTDGGANVEAGPVDMSDVWQALAGDGEVQRLTYGAATSRAYDRGKKRMLADGHDPDAAGEFAKKQYALAGHLWKLARESEFCVLGRKERREKK